MSLARGRVVDWRDGVICGRRGRIERKRKLIGGVNGFLDVEQRRHFVEMPANLGGEIAVETLDRGYVVGARFANAFEAAEVTQQ